MADIVDRLRWEADRLPLKFSNNSELFDLLLEAAKTIEELTVDIGVYDKEEIRHNCTVQILTNTATGTTSIGWWPEGAIDDNT